jgi:hypothetical protein
MTKQSKKEESKEVATVGEHLPSTSFQDFEEHASAGMEEVSSKDVIIPRLTLLQSLSPQLNKKKGEYIEEADIGMICDLGTGDLFPEEILFLPVHYRKDYLEWAPRATGKGLIAIHTDPRILDNCKKDDKNKLVLPNGNYIAETAQWFGLNLSAGRRPCYIPMTSTQLKRSRRWMTMAIGERLVRADGSEFAAPLFYRVYRLSSATDSNAEGEWATWVVNRDVALPDIKSNVDWRQIKAEAVAFRESILRGEAKADQAEAEQADSEGAM